ncbi:MAG: serine hydrolase [Pirellula sp.]
MNSVLFGQDASRNTNSSPAIREAMQGFVAKHEIAGAVTLVASPNAIVHLDAVGLANVSNQSPMKTDSIHWIASMSKPVTAACVMMLVDEGKLSLADPIAKHLPEMSELKLANGDAVSITLEHVLNHTSGMSEIPDGKAYADATLAAAALKYAKLPVLFPPGSKWQYSQTGINTAARIVEVVSGMSFDRFVDERLCKPLGMNDTAFYLSEAQVARLATSYSKEADGTLRETTIRLLSGKKPTDRDRLPAGNGGLFSTAEDYAKFCQMLLNDGQWNNKQILTPKSVARLASPTTGELKTGFTDGNTWGVGCCIVRQPQGVSSMLSPGTFGHGGAYGTQAWIDPLKKRCYILMVQRSNFPNSDNSEVRRVFQQIAADPLTIPIWPDKAPGEVSELPESEFTEGGTRFIAGKRIYLVTNVSKPELAIYRPEPSKDTGAAVVICPGGAHRLLAYDLEGTEVAQWLNSIGVTGIVLKYRVPSRTPEFKCQAALQDVQRAISLVRSRAKEFGIDSQRIGVLGFSAGGEVAARASLQFNDRKYTKIDAVDEVPCRPDFSMLIYPAYLVDKQGELLQELKPTAQTPPTFFVHAWDDNVTPLSSLQLATELKKIAVSCELHLFRTGGHGYGLRHVDGMPVTDWANQAALWLNNQFTRK